MKNNEAQQIYDLADKIANKVKENQFSKNTISIEILEEIIKKENIIKKFIKHCKVRKFNKGDIVKFNDTIYQVVTVFNSASNNNEEKLEIIGLGLIEFGKTEIIKVTKQYLIKVKKVKV